MGYYVTWSAELTIPIEGRTAIITALVELETGYDFDTIEDVPEYMAEAGAMVGFDADDDSIEFEAHGKAGDTTEKIEELLFQHATGGWLHWIGEDGQVGGWRIENGRRFRLKQEWVDAGEITPQQNEG